MCVAYLGLPPGVNILITICNANFHKPVVVVKTGGGFKLKL